MIVTVTLNAALDVTYRAPEVRTGGTHRVKPVAVRAGGKGINVAAVLHRMSRDVLVTGVIGQLGGDRLRRDLDDRGLDHELFDVPGETRQTVTVVSQADGDATIFTEFGPPIGPGDWARVLNELTALFTRTAPAVVVLSGSLPPGVPSTAYADLGRAARAAAARVVVDADGEVLLAAAAVGPDLVKPNRAELESATGRSGLWDGAAELQRHGARDVVVSDGERGLVLVPLTGPRLLARPCARLKGNPTGAGDAAVAALSDGLDRGIPAEDMLRQATAWSAAAVLAPAAGDLDPAEVEVQHRGVDLRTVDDRPNGSATC